jgi:hypothetical protein
MGLLFYSVVDSQIFNDSILSARSAAMRQVIWKGDNE